MILTSPTNLFDYYEMLCYYGSSYKSSHSVAYATQSGPIRQACFKRIIQPELRAATRLSDMNDTD